MRKKLKSLISSFKATRLVVLGDFLLDQFEFGEISRVSREAPVLILNFCQTRYCPGGGANTVANAAALGATVVPLGVLGDDETGDQLIDLWPTSVNTDHLVRLPDQATTRKTRILAGSFHSFRQQVVRMDYLFPIQMTSELENRISANLETVLPGSGGLIISDYSLGLMSAGLRRRAVLAASRHDVPVIVDSRDHPHCYKGATTVTPNITEVEKTQGAYTQNKKKALERLGATALKDWGLQALLVTRGRLGMSLFSKDSTAHIPPFGSEEAVDVTGAGDTVAATYATALASGATFLEAARLANLAGGLVVMKTGTATVSRQELTEAVEVSAGESD